VKWVTRRALLAGVAAASTVFWANPTQAFLASGKANVVAASQLTTMTLSETAGNTIASNFIPPMFGHPFKKGDIVAGTYPKFTLNDGTTNVPFTMMNAVYWADGSLKHASFLIRPPTGIAANSSITIKIFTGGTAPGSSSRGTSDFSAADLRLAAVGLDNLSGTWTSILNNGISGTNQSFSGPDIVSYTDGAVGRVYRIRASFEQSSAAHGQMECYWYVAALQNSSGGLYGIRYLGRLTQPWYNSTNTPTRTFRSFSALSTLSGASQQRDLFATYLQPQTITRSSGNTFNATTTNRLQAGMAVQLSTTGVMPTGLSAATTYWVYVPSSGHIQFSTAAQPSTVGNAIVTVTSDGTGTLTLTPVAYCCMFGSLYTNGDTATWDYIQGGGSIAADVTVRCSFDKTYWRLSRMVPSYDLTISPTSNAAQVMFPGWGGPVSRATTTTGERDDIGVLTAWASRHFYTQAAVDEQVVRVVGLTGGQWSVCLKDTTTKSLPVINNSSYAGMPTANNQFRWSPAGGGGSIVTGFTVPSNNQCLACFNNQETSHQPDFGYYAYLLTGEPQFLDIIGEFASNAIWDRLPTLGTAAVSGATNTIGAQRNPSVNGTQYYGTCLGVSTLRADAWAIRCVAAAAAFMPGNPDNASYGTYFADLLAATFNAGISFNAMQTSFWTTNGVWCFNSEQADMWMHGYWIQANAFTYAITELSTALTILNHTVKFPAYVKNTFGGWHVGSYQEAIRTTASPTGPIITADSQFGVFAGSGGGGNSVSWTSGVADFTVNIASVTYTPTAGDQFIFDSLNGSIPGNFTEYQTYYVVNPTATTIQLSATPGGSPITPNTTANDTPFFIWTNPPSTGGFGLTGPDGYSPNVRGGLSYALAAGATVDAGTLSDMNNRISVAAISFTGNPKYDMTSTF
jgi:hypothetical protein